MAVLVIDKKGNPLTPCTERRARVLLACGRAKIHRIMPLIIRLKDTEAKDSTIQPVTLKINPGSKFSTLALVAESPNKNIIGRSVYEIQHRGNQIRDALVQRAGFRRRRRNNNIRHRQPRWANRTKPEGWLAPSLQHRVNTITSWVDRLQRYAPIGRISICSAKFDTQKIDNPDIHGEEYSQGTLFEHEVKGYLLERYEHKCAYCGKKDTRLWVNYVVPKSKGGSNRVSNLVVACHSCVEKKGGKTLEEFLKNKTSLAKIKLQLKKPMGDISAINSTRNAIVRELAKTGLPMEISTQGHISYNRYRLRLAKSRTVDALCVGETGEIVSHDLPVLAIKCFGRGSYKRTTLNKYGFPRGYLMRKKMVFGFQTGDICKAVVEKGNNAGTHFGRIVVRERGSFKVDKADGISWKKCKLMQRSDGYGYSFLPKGSQSPENDPPATDLSTSP